MSFYRSLIATVAAMTLTTCVFAADESTANATATPDAQATTAAPAIQTADASSVTQAAPAATDTTAPTDQQKLNINTATAKELMKVKGMSAAKAKAVVTFRKTHGDFKSLDDLKGVKGFKKMSDKTMKKLQDKLTVG